MITWIVTNHEPGDGTCYTFHIMKHTYGGYLVCCNDSSMWLFFPRDNDIAFLAGVDNIYTSKAIRDYMSGLNL